MSVLAALLVAVGATDLLRSLVLVEPSCFDVARGGRKA